MGEEVRAPIVGDLNPKSKAHEVGLRPGDTVLKVGNDAVSNWDEFQSLLNKNSGRSAEVQVQRRGFEAPVIVPVQPESRPNPTFFPWILTSVI
jgi:regulator of sigma E protease